MLGEGCIIMVYKTPKEVEERKDAKRRHILDCATKVFSERGYHGTTVRDVLAEAGVSTGSFYFYFSNKEDLFETLYDEMNRMYLNVIQVAVENLAENVVESICKAITLALWSFQKNKALGRIMLIEAVGLNPRFEQKRAANNKRFSMILEDVLGEMQNKGIVQLPDIKVAALSFMGSIYTFITDWLQDETVTDPVEYAYPLVVYNMQAIGLKFDEKAIKECIDGILKLNYEELMGE